MHVGLIISAMNMKWMKRCMFLFHSFFDNVEFG